MLGKRKKTRSLFCEQVTNLWKEFTGNLLISVSFLFGSCPLWVLKLVFSFFNIANCKAPFTPTHHSFVSTSDGEHYDQHPSCDNLINYLDKNQKPKTKKQKQNYYLNSLKEIVKTFDIFEKGIYLENIDNK